MGVCSWFPRHKTDTQIPSFYCPQYVPEQSKKYFLNPDKSHSQNLYLYKGSTSILPSPLKRKVKWLYVLYLTCWDCSHLSLPFCCNNCCWTRNDVILCNCCWPLSVRRSSQPCCGVCPVCYKYLSGLFIEMFEFCYIILSI